MVSNKVVKMRTSNSTVGPAQTQHDLQHYHNLSCHVKLGDFCVHLTTFTL